MASKSEGAITVGTLYRYSKSLWEDREELEGLPYQSAYEEMVGSDDKDPLWVRIEDDDIKQSELEEYAEIIKKYPYWPGDDMKSWYKQQKKYAILFDVDVRFDTYDVRMAKDLINKVNEGRLLSVKQFKYLKYFVYRYREQLKDKIIYEEDTTDRLDEMLGDDPRTTLKEMIDNCKEAHKEVNPRQ